MQQLNRGPRGVAARGSKRTAQVIEVATAYHHEGLEQEKIAQRMGISRSTVSRMLTEALETGIVEIRINRPVPVDPALQRELVRALDLKDAIVLDTGGAAGNPLPDLGRLAAQRINAILEDDDVLAISWGTGVLAAVEGFEEGVSRRVEVVQMLGGAGSLQPRIDGTELARLLAHVLGARYRFLNAPLVVANERVASAILEEPSIRETLRVAATARLALVGVGTFEGGVSSFQRSGHLQEQELATMRALGAVGDVCGHIVALDGSLLDAPLSHRIVTMDVDDLRNIPTVMAVSGGPHKIAPILGSARARLFNVLVTDDATALGLLEAVR